MNASARKSDTLELRRGHGKDQSKIDALIASLYEVISFDEGGSPDWERMRGLFSRHARITRITPDGTDYYDLDSFQDMAKEAFEYGVYTRFYEVELRRDERTFGGLAHVLSAYETKQSPDATEPMSRGVNSIQLILEDGEWKVLSLFWDEESIDNRLTLGNLFETGGERAEANP